MSMVGSKRRGGRGFTLIEMMLVVGLIGILATLAIGTSKDWRRRQDHRELVREAFNALNMARAHSLQFGVTSKVSFDDVNHQIVAFVEPSASADCLYTGAGGESIIYRFPEPIAADQKLKAIWVTAVGHVYDADMSVTVADPVSCNGQHTVVYEHRGFSVGLTDSPRSPTVTISDAESGDSMKIDISVAGALRVR